MNNTVHILRRAGRLKRLHTVPTVEAHTLARHVYGSQIIALALLTHNPGARKDRVLEALLLHDAAEVVTGDVPAPAKRRSQMLDASLRKAEREFEEHYGIGIELNDLERDLVKACDTLDLGFACAEEFRLGNRDEYLQNVLANVLEYIKEQYHVPGVRDAAFALHNEVNK